MISKNINTYIVIEIVFVMGLSAFAAYMTKAWWIILFGIIITGSIFFLLYMQRKKYEDDLIAVTDMVSRMLSDSSVLLLSETDDILKSKIQHQLLRLQSIITTYSDKAKKDKEEIRNLIVEIAHQLRMPLANIQTYIDLLKDEHCTKEEKEKYISAIETSEKNLTFLIESFIKMSRFENKIIQIRKNDTDLGTTILGALDRVRIKADEKQIKMEFDRNETPQVNHDKNWLSESIINLLDNGVKYSEEGSTIEVTAIKNEMFVQIKVRDYGTPIPKDELNKIFQRFYRGSNVTNEEGFGVGLYLSREIVEAHDGFIRVRPESDGNAFSIFLPQTGKDNKSE